MAACPERDTMSAAEGSPRRILQSLRQRFSGKRQMPTRSGPHRFGDVSWGERSLATDADYRCPRCMAFTLRFSRGK
jgi:hypothetical protein